MANEVHIAVNDGFHLSEIQPGDKAAFVKHLNDADIYRSTLRIPYPYKGAIANASTADLVGRRRIQGFDVTGIGAVFHSVAHFRGHVQEIVHLTRSQLGDAYQFDFVPKTPEQGAT